MIKKFTLTNVIYKYGKSCIMFFFLVSVHPKINIMQVWSSRNYSYLEIDLIKKLLTCLPIKKILVSSNIESKCGSFILRCNIYASLIITGHSKEEDFLKITLILMVLAPPLRPKG